MTRTVLVDDHLLLRVLLGEEPRSIRPSGATVATTGLWYHRLCRALADDSVIGSMSRQLGDLGSELAAEVIAKVIELPDTIELVSFRTLGWPMADTLHNGARLNLLSLEAIAAARHLDAEICLAEIDDNRSLHDAARDRSIEVRTIA